MKRLSFLHRLLFLGFLLLLSLNGIAQHRVFLLHPTAGDLGNFFKLVQEKVIDIPDLEVVGLYFDKEVYDYRQSEAYIQEKNIPHCTLIKVTGELNPQNIYGENDCTPVFKKVVEKANAILFFGGPDIQPVLYGEKQHLLTVVTDPGRHLFEASLFFHLIGGSRNPGFKPLLSDRPDLVVRAFCLGMQTLNVAAGGTLLQDIPMQRYKHSTAEEMLEIGTENQHRNYNTQLNPLTDLSWAKFHPIKITPKGFLAEISADLSQKMPVVLSSHHQAAGKIGANLEVIAWSPDGKIVEGLQHKEFRNVVGVQFHPEQSSLYNPESEYEMKPGEVIHPNQILKETGSLEFHEKFWKDFSERVTGNR